jgi:translation initiation factor 6
MITLTTFHGDPNLGIFFFANENFCLAPISLGKKNYEKIVESLKVKVLRTKIAESDLIGILCAGNSKGIVISHLVHSTEFKKLKKMLKEFDINLSKIRSKYSAIGNLILCNDKGAVVSNLISRRERKKLQDVLDVEICTSTIANLSIVGSCGIATNKGCLLHRDVDEDEIKIIKDVLKVNADIGTTNFGSPFVGSCLIANSKGALVGEKTTPPEIAKIMEALNLL